MFYLFNGYFCNFKLHKVLQKSEFSWSSFNKIFSKSERNKILGPSIYKTRNHGLSDCTIHRPKQFFLRLSRLLTTVPCMRKLLLESFFFWFISCSCKIQMNFPLNCFSTHTVTILSSFIKSQTNSEKCKHSCLNFYIIG